MGALIAMAADMARSAISLIIGPVMQDVIGEAVAEEEAIGQSVVMPLERVDLAMAKVQPAVLSPEYGLEAIKSAVDALPAQLG